MIKPTIKNKSLNTAILKKDFRLARHANNSTKKCFHHLNIHAQLNNRSETKQILNTFATHLSYISLISLTNLTSHHSLSLLHLFYCFYGYTLLLGNEIASLALLGIDLWGDSIILSSETQAKGVGIWRV